MKGQSSCSLGWLPRLTRGRYRLRIERLAPLIPSPRDMKFDIRKAAIFQIFQWQPQPIANDKLSLSTRTHRNLDIEHPKANE
jgi:hypothetical protein